MIVLGLDTATAATAVAVRADGTVLGERRDDPGPHEHPGHATRLLAMAEELLQASALAWSSLDRIAVGVGPGGFTGLRVGVATARGIAHALSLELVGVSSLAALALAALSGTEEQSQPRPGHDAVLAVIDARRGEVFASTYARGTDTADGTGVAELAPPRALAPERLCELTAEAEREDGGGQLRWLAVGDGALRYSEALERLGIATAAAQSPLHSVRARWICELGAQAQPASGYRSVLPDYLRRPDAELALEDHADEAHAWQR